jgi:hypothetical protein
MKFTINLVQRQRAEEQRAEGRRLRVSVFAMVSFGILGVAILFTFFQIVTMGFALAGERNSLTLIKAEYGKYRSTRMIVDKADLALLDSLQGGRIFWTKKLAALASHLPENYWITQFSYDPPAFHAAGYGCISPQQNQLVTINEYLTRLRQDSTYSDVFHKTMFNSTSRIDERTQSRVSFAFSSVR